MSNRTSDNHTINSFAEWQPDKDVDQCLNCDAKFSFFLRRHHCRCCGGIFCGDCAKRFISYNRQKVRVVRRASMDVEIGPYRTCEPCYRNLYSLGLLSPSWNTRIHAENDNDNTSSSELINSNTSLRTNVPAIAEDRSDEAAANLLEEEPDATEDVNAREETHREANFCPICSKAYSQIVENTQNEEAIQCHIEACLKNAERVRQHSNGSENVNANAEGEAPSGIKKEDTPVSKNRMLIYKVPTDQDREDPSEYPECSICFEEMVPGDKVGRLECLCVFHYKCIKSWFIKKSQKMSNKNHVHLTKNFCPLHDAVF